MLDQLEVLRNLEDNLPTSEFHHCFEQAGFNIVGYYITESDEPLILVLGLKPDLPVLPYYAEEVDVSSPIIGMISVEQLSGIRYRGNAVFNGYLCPANSLSITGNPGFDHDSIPLKDLSSNLSAEYNFSAPFYNEEIPNLETVEGIDNVCSLLFKGIEVGNALFFNEDYVIFNKHGFDGHNPFLFQLKDKEGNVYDVDPFAVSHVRKDDDLVLLRLSSKKPKLNLAENLTEDQYVYSLHLHKGVVYKQEGRVLSSTDHVVSTTLKSAYGFSGSAVLDENNNLVAVHASVNGNCQNVMHLNYWIQQKADSKN